MIKNKYGYLTEDFREFVITEPRTPRPWFNYMWNENYAGLLSHTGGGFSFFQSPRDNRISRMRYNCLPWDRPGRYILVKDTENGEYWSLSWAPTIDKKYDFYEARVGQGYTTIITEYAKIRAELTYFVPTDVNCEIWSVLLKDLSGKNRKLEIYAFQELMMGNALNDIINQPNDKHFTDIKFNPDWQTLEATRRYWVLNKKSATVEQPNISWAYRLYFGMNLPVSGFDGSLDRFIGKWRSESNPVCVEEGKMGNTQITAGDPVVALQSRVNLKSDEDLKFSVILGIASKEDTEPYNTLEWKNLGNESFVKNKLDQVKAYWDHYLGHVKVNTPDEAFNAMLNVWNQYQSAVTFDMARNSGYYHGGLLFGTGMRDQFQDILGMVIVQPERVRSRILNALQYQFAEGSTLHNFFALTGHGERTHHSDTPLWIPFGIVEYLNETGDFSILNEKVRFYDEGEDTVFQHMVRALDFAIRDTSHRGIPLIRKGDWNDTLDHIGPKGKGESIWGAFFLCYVLDKTFELLDYLKETSIKSRWQQAYHKIADTLNQSAWDGEWYMRAVKDNGEIVGSSKSRQGKLFINTQSWSVISKVAPKEKGIQALEKCLEHMENKTGIQLVWPAYREIDDTTGLISRCVPGKKENGAVFNHASSWFALSAFLAGKIEEGYRIYNKMIPFNSSVAIDIDRYETEPYVYSEYITSFEHETEGQASHSWLTGSSVWQYRTGLDIILGFKTCLQGVSFIPHIPSQWKRVNFERKFRGKKFIVEINNSGNNQAGIKELLVNGVKLDDNFVNPVNYKGEIINISIQL
jgi:cellobiose phosphorylase